MKTKNYLIMSLGTIIVLVFLIAAPVVTGSHLPSPYGTTLGGLSTSGNPVPEPATMLLLGSGLLMLAGIGRKKLQKQKSV